MSVIVPIYDVAPYLETCLESLAQQTLADLEILVVDDGSTDAGPEIAERFVARDGRFRLIRQTNAGLGAARNAGLDAAGGELVAFVDGDDVVPRRAYEALLRALDRTGSDFACGAVRRLTSLGTTRAQFLGSAFDRERLKTHITRFPDLVADRLACNKLVRRSFWDRQGFRFPEGVRNEDIPVMLPAHYLARSVDVLAETVYLWRRRESGDLSGSQKRVSLKGLRDRAGAVDHVSRFLAARGMAEEKLLYDRSVVGNDLRYFLDVLDTTEAEFQHLFLELANAFLDRADERVLEQPLAIERLRWQLVRRRALPELLEVVAFQAERLSETPPVRQGRAWYGDYPFREDPRLEIPVDVYRLRDELAPVVHLSELSWQGDDLRVEGYAYIELLGAPQPDSQQVELVVRRPGSSRVLRRLTTTAVHRPDVTRDAAQEVVSLDWSGFAATLDVARLGRWGRRGAGTWEVGVVIRAGDVEATVWELKPAPLRAPATARIAKRTSLRAELSPGGLLTVRSRRQRPVLRSCSVEDGVLELEGRVRPPTDERLVLRIARRDGTARLEYAVEPAAAAGDGSAFRAKVPLQDLALEVDVTDEAARTEDQGEGIVWDLFLVGKQSRRLALDQGAQESIWIVAGREISLERTRFDTVRIVERSFRPVVTGVAWADGGVLELSGSFRGPAGDYELVLRSRGDTHVLPLSHDPEAARFRAELPVGGIDSLAGRRPLAEGRWELFVRPRGGSTAGAAVVLDHELLDRLPVSATIGRKRFDFGVAGYDVPLLEVSADLDEDEQGGYRQRLLRTSFYRAQRQLGLRDVVLYDCFGGREYSDSPRAIHEELVRRELPLEHLWVVRDGACQVPPTARVVPRLSAEYYEAYASARFVVANDHWPPWCARRPEQTWLQTWRGPPLKRLGRDLAGRPKVSHDYRRVVGQPAENWQYVVSPGAYATPILERAFAPSGGVLETGLPRTDVLHSPEGDRLAVDVRRRLGLPAGKRAILYAPTYRDQLGAGERFRLGPLLDLEAVRAALGEDDVLLFRRHRFTVGEAPARADGIVDVSTFPDGTELLLAADVLVTDYSSAFFDFAGTGRPMLFYTPDLEVYRDEVRGFSIDFEADAPGPLLRTSAEVVDALRDLDAVQRDSRARYERFVATYCPLDDGGASSRVVERVFGS
ncbi:MAG: CDP-glycerol glycerophosphotransferase family protein [Gaiellaceae bacterium]